MNNLNIYVGYDSKEDIAYRVCKHSLLKRSNNNIKVYSLKLQGYLKLKMLIANSFQFLCFVKIQQKIKLTR